MNKGQKVTLWYALALIVVFGLFTYIGYNPDKLTAELGELKWLGSGFVLSFYIVHMAKTWE